MCCVCFMLVNWWYCVGCRCWLEWMLIEFGSGLVGDVVVWVLYVFVGFVVLFFVLLMEGGEGFWW